MSLATLTETRKKVRKSPKIQVAKTAKKSFYLSEEAVARLGVHACMEGRSESDVIDALILENLKKWRVARWAGTLAEPSDLAYPSQLTVSENLPVNIEEI